MLLKTNLRPATLSLHEIPNGTAGVRMTLNVMAQFAREGRLNLNVRNTATDILRGVAQKDWAGQVRALFYFVRDSIRYVHDPVDAELVQAPDVILATGAGDCDDKATLLAALLLSTGHPARFVAVGFAPGDLSHVFVETLMGSRWIALDATEPVEPGWFPPNVKSTMIGHI